MVPSTATLSVQVPKYKVSVKIMSTIPHKIETLNTPHTPYWVLCTFT